MSVSFTYFKNYKKPPTYFNKQVGGNYNKLFFLKLIYFCKPGLIDTSFAGIGLQGNASVKVGDELNAAGSVASLSAFTSSKVSVLMISYHLVHSPANSHAFSQTTSSQVAEVKSGVKPALFLTAFKALKADASEVLPEALI